MRDPLSFAADAAAMLGLAPRAEEVRAEPVFSWLEYATLEETEAVVAEHRRLRRPDVGPVEVPDEWMRRAEFRHALGLLVRSDSGEPHHLLRCLSGSPWWLRAMSRCRCVERALCEVAAEVSVVDAAAVVEVRARAAARHARIVGVFERLAGRRREALRARDLARRSVEPSASGVRRIGAALGTVGGPDFVEVVEPEPVVAVRSSLEQSRQRSWSTSAGRRTGRSLDEFGRKVAELANVSYSTSSWRALPTVDSPREEPS